MLATALLPAAGACGDRIAGPSIPLDWGDGFGPVVYPLTLTDVPNFLTGDSVQVSVWASSGDPASTWELTGPAVFVLPTGAVATRIGSPASDVWIRGMGSGAVNLKAVRHSRVDSATTSFYVADPLDVRLRVVQGRDLTIRLGDDGWIAAHLLDSENRYYVGAFGWSSSDTNSVTLADDVNHSRFGKLAHGQSVGSAKIVIAYRGQRDTANVSVTP